MPTCTLRWASAAAASPEPVKSFLLPLTLFAVVHNYCITVAIPATKRRKHYQFIEFAKVGTYKQYEATQQVGLTQVTNERTCRCL